MAVPVQGTPWLVSEVSCALKRLSETGDVNALTLTPLSGSWSGSRDYPVASIAMCSVLNCATGILALE